MGIIVFNLPQSSATWVSSSSSFSLPSLIVILFAFLILIFSIKITTFQLTCHAVWSVEYISLVRWLLWFSWLIQVVLVLEFFNTSASVSEFLLTCKEWMARWANVRSDFFIDGLCHKCVTACASYFTFLVVRMDSFFHAKSPLSCSGFPPLHNYC